MGISRLELVEIIETQAAKLTPEGRDLAERMELLAEISPGPEHPPTHTAQRSQADEAWDLPPRDRSIIELLLMLWEGLVRSDDAERRGELGDRYRNMAVILAAGTKDRNEGRQIDPNMTPERAAARLREDD